MRCCSNAWLREDCRCGLPRLRPDTDCARRNYVVFFWDMRPSIFVLMASLCAAQIPADPFELVAGKAVVKTADRTQALALLNKAKRPMRLLAPMTQPYLLT